MQVTATEAKNRFGYYLSQAEREPIHVLKNERVAGVIVSAARYAELTALAVGVLLYLKKNIQYITGISRRTAALITMTVSAIATPVWRSTFHAA